MDLLLIFINIVAILVAGSQAGMISYAPPAPVRCQDDPEMAEFCPKFKEKKFCETKIEVMEMICAKTCEYCPKEKFSKGIDEIIKEQKKIEKAAGGDIPSIKEDLKEGGGSPNAKGGFGGKGDNDAEKEATEVPEKEGDAGGKGDEKEGSGGGSPGKEDEKEAGEKEGGKTEGGGGEAVSGGGDGDTGEDVGEVGSTNGCDKKCQTECVQAHNKYRANHGAPPLKWDKTLADQAQAVASKNAADNQFKHSDWAAGKGGECIAWGPIKPSWLIAVKDWHDEEKNYDWNTGKSSNGKAIGHFTQVVWKKATKVGCGKSEMTMYGSKGPFYIAQMDVVGIVQNKKELDLVGKPKKPDMEWFKDMRDKQMKANKQSKKDKIPQVIKLHRRAKKYHKKTKKSAAKPYSIE